MSHGRQASISSLPGVWWILRLPRRLELEVLDHVGEVGALGLEARFGHRSDQQVSGRADEWFTHEILTVARLLADHHQLRTRRPLTKDRLRCVPVQRACGAAGGGLTQSLDPAAAGHLGGRGAHAAGLPSTPYRVTIGRASKLAQRPRGPVFRIQAGPLATAEGVSRRREGRFTRPISTRHVSALDPSQQGGRVTVASADDSENGRIREPVPRSESEEELLRRYAATRSPVVREELDPQLHAARALAGDALPPPDRVARRPRPGCRPRPRQGDRRLRPRPRAAVRGLRRADDPRRAAPPLPRPRLERPPATRAAGADDEARFRDQRPSPRSSAASRRRRSSPSGSRSPSRTCSRASRPTTRGERCRSTLRAAATRRTPARRSRRSSRRGRL